jgi:hypothetical protein
MLKLLVFWTRLVFATQQQEEENTIPISRERLQKMVQYFFVYHFIFLIFHFTLLSAFGRGPEAQDPPPPPRINSKCKLQMIVIKCTVPVFPYGECT